MVITRTIRSMVKVSSPGPVEIYTKVITSRTSDTEMDRCSGLMAACMKANG
jgi:hypothetical protein